MITCEDELNAILNTGCVNQDGIFNINLSLPPPQSPWYVCSAVSLSSSSLTARNSIGITADTLSTAYAEPIYTKHVWFTVNVN